MKATQSTRGRGQFCKAGSGRRTASFLNSRPSASSFFLSEGRKCPLKGHPNDGAAEPPAGEITPEGRAKGRYVYDGAANTTSLFALSQVVTLGSCAGRVSTIVSAVSPCCRQPEEGQGSGW